MGALFLIGGAALLLHRLLCGIARRGLGDRQELEEELFAVPNRWLAGKDPGRDSALLRVRYFLPFSALPDGTQTLEPWVRATLWAARVSGLGFVCAMLGFFAAAFIEAGR